MNLNRQTTPLNFGTMPNDDDEAWIKHEAEMGAEGMVGQPLRPAAEGIAAMQERIDYLKKEKADAVLQWEKSVTTSPLWESELSKLDKEISAAEARLAEYKTLHEGRN